MISAWAVPSRSSRAIASFSSSLRVSEPISLHGVRCRATSTTPPASCQDSASPLNSVFIRLLDRLLDPIHSFNLVAHASGDQVALELAVRRQHPIFDRERFGLYARCPHLFEVR